MYYPWLEEYCLTKPGAVKEPVDVWPPAYVSAFCVPPAFRFMIGERGLIGRQRFVVQSRTDPLALSPDPFRDMRPYFRFTQDGNFIRPFIDLKLTPASGDFFRHKFEEDIFRAYDPNNEGWNRICIDGQITDDIIRRLIDMSYALTFKSIPAPAREVITGPEKICPNPQKRYCRLCSIFCERENKYPWIESYCLTKADATKRFDEECQTIRFLVKWQAFAMRRRDNTGRPVIILKLAPAERESLRRQFRDIIPGYPMPDHHMNTTRWESVYLDGSIPDETLREMIDQSYTIISAMVNR